MQPYEELEEIASHHYGKFDSGEQTDTIQEIYSLRYGVVSINNDSKEWFDSRDSILAFLKAGSSGEARSVSCNVCWHVST